MSAIKIVLIDQKGYVIIKVDGKKVCSCPTYHPKELAHALELIFEAMVIENIEITNE